MGTERRRLMCRERGRQQFFVISGFVITGVLLRERQSTGGTSALGFYARRVRRILPAASLVIVAVRPARLTFFTPRTALIQAGSCSAHHRRKSGVVRGPPA